jgi:hypothetical protein
MSKTQICIAYLGLRLDTQGMYQSQVHSSAFRNTQHHFTIVQGSHKIQQRVKAREKSLMVVFLVLLYSCASTHSSAPQTLLLSHQKVAPKPQTRL